MPAIEVKTNKWIIIEKDASGKYFIRVTKTSDNKFVVPLANDERGETEKYTAIGPFYVQGKWAYPLIEHPDGNGHMPANPK